MKNKFQNFESGFFDYNEFLILKKLYPNKFIYEKDKRFFCIKDIKHKQLLYVGSKSLKSKYNRLWERYKYDDLGRLLRYENSFGYWERYEYKYEKDGCQVIMYVYPNKQKPYHTYFEKY